MTECEISGCHETATTTITLLGMLRHVCDEHAHHLTDEAAGAEANDDTQPQ